MIALSCLACTASVRGDPTEPEITITPIPSLGFGLTDRWIVQVDYPDGSVESFTIIGTRSDPIQSVTYSEIQDTTIHDSSSRVVQQDILLGFSHSWDYELSIVGHRISLLEFNLDIGFPVQVALQYSEPMIEGVSYTMDATLTPLDWPDFDEFVSNLRILGTTIYDTSQSFVTPIGPENAWTPFELGPFWIWTGIFLFLATLDVGLAIIPELYSDRVEASVGVTGDASLQSPDLLAWSAPGQTLQFDVLAEDVSPLDYATILLSQFEYFLNKLLIGFNLVLQLHTIFGSVRGDLRLFTLDATGLLPTLSFGTHTSSPASQIQADIPVVKFSNVIPEVPWGTVMASAAMIIALVAYVTWPKWRRKHVTKFR